MHTAPPENSCLCLRLVVKLWLEFLPKMADKVRKKIRISYFGLELDSGRIE